MIGASLSTEQRRVKDLAQQYATYDGTPGSVRRALFDGGEGPLDGYSWPRPRFNNWERAM
jgi:hypothetical protein